jgi:acetolactate synthase-1/2/3 large subunit
MIDDYIEAMNKAKNPVILAGWGVRASDAIDQFRAFIAQVNVPVLLTWKGIDILPDDNPYFCGRPGSIGQRAANIIQQKSDFLLILGCRLDPDQVGFDYKNFAPNARKVAVDIDVHEANKYPPGFAQFLVYDIAEFLKDTSEYTRHDSKWLDWCKELNVKYPACLPEHLEGDNTNLYMLAEELSTQCTSEDVLAIGSSGPSANILLQTWKVKDGQRFIYAPAIGAMGSDVPMSIGACNRSGKRRTICVTGDGGFQLNAQELEGIRRENLPIKIFVASNHGYGSIAMMQDKYFGHRVGADEASGFTIPSIGDVSRAYGIPCFYIRRKSNMTKIVKMVLGMSAPCVIEVETPLLQAQTPRIRSEMIDGQITPFPMEDMYPELPELKELMNA